MFGPLTTRVAGSPWAGYLLRRLVGLVVVVAATVVLTFMIVRWVPGDPARNLLGLSATPDQLRTAREQLGLTQSLWHQFGQYLSDLAHADFGTSFLTHQPVRSMLGQRLPVTLRLAGGALLVVLALGIPIGIAIGVAQQRRRLRPVTSSFPVVASVLGAMPEYIAGTVLVYLFAVKLSWLPVQGGESLRSLVLPVLAVAIAPTAILARLVRNETVDVLSQDYITTALSRRISQTRLLVRHVLPNVVTSTLTLSGLLLVSLLGGTVVTENVFNMAGLGSEVVHAITRRDYPEVQGIILVLGLIAIGINLVVDIVLGVLDPRVLRPVRS